MDDLDLRAALEHGSEHLDPPGPPVTAWARGRRARRRRRGAVAAGVSALAVVTVVVGVRGATGPQVEGPQPGTSSPTPTSYPTPPTYAAPPIADAVVQEFWDPDQVESLPAAQVGSLPSSLVPPSEAPSLASATLPDAAALVDTGDGLWVLAGDASWRSLAYPEQPLPDGDSALSRDGTRVITTGVTALWSVDVRGGSWRRTDYPQGFRADKGWEGELLPETMELVHLQTADRSWYLDLDSGWREENLMRIDGLFTNNTRIAFTGVIGQRWTRWWGDGGMSELRSDELQSLARPASDNDSIAAVRTVVRWDDNRRSQDWDGLIALETTSLATRAYLPIRDGNAWYSDGGGLAAVAWVDRDTVLAAVIPKSSGGYVDGERFLVTWDVESGDLRRVSSLPAAYDLSLAGALL